jgi:hypothetical protein
MMKRSKLVFAVCALVFITVTGCNSKETPAPAAPAHQGQPAMMAPADNGLSGKVVETMNAGGYTYVYLDNSGTKTWVAVPQTAVKVGQQITCQPGQVMINFTSPTLKRTFESIVFSGGLR